MSDDFEQLRRAKLAELNSNPKDRAALAAIYGEGGVWDTAQLGQAFEVIGYLAPYVVVRRREDGTVGSLLFQHQPRWYFGFEADEPRVSSTCSWCSHGNLLTQQHCGHCGHEAHVARTLCRCRRCCGSEPPEPLTLEDIEAALDLLRQRRGSE
jgi:hypothetical protein